MIKLFEIYSSDVPQTAGLKIYETFQKKWLVREIWVNPSQVVSISEYEIPDEVIASLPQGLLTDAGFSNVSVSGGYHGSAIVAVGNPRYIAEKILELQR
jgi:hypothetical protein